MDVERLSSLTRAALDVEHLPFETRGLAVLFRGIFDFLALAAPELSDKADFASFEMFDDVVDLVLFHNGMIQYY